MLDYKIIFGTLTICIGVVSYSFYFKDLFKGKTKPDAFSWLIWGVLASIVFFAQNMSGGGPGSWTTAFTALMCFTIATVAFSRGGSRLKAIDTISLIGAALGVILWFYTNDPFLTVLLAIGIGAMGFVPTFRKAFKRPREETSITYLLNGLKFAIAIIALEQFTLVTWLYPAALVLLNVSLAATIYLGRRS